MSIPGIFLLKGVQAQEPFLLWCQMFFIFFPLPQDGYHPCSNSDVFSSGTECPFQAFFFLMGFKLKNRSFCGVRCFSSFFYYPRMVIIHFGDEKHLSHMMLFISFTEVKYVLRFGGKIIFF
jgi:hypothetical protein